MRMLKLDIDKLEVDSFETNGAGEERGTVHGHYPTQYATCVTSVCGCSGADGLSCEVTCDATCYASCDGTCERCTGNCYLTGTTTETPQYSDACR
jgi:hypothetical protein